MSHKDWHRHSTLNDTVRRQNEERGIVPKKANGAAKPEGHQSYLAPIDEAPSIVANDDRVVRFPKVGATLDSAKASTYELSAIRWLWPNRFALGKLGLLAGLPDEGKGQVFADIAARVTRGAEWPCNEGARPAGQRNSAHS